MCFLDTVFNSNEINGVVSNIILDQEKFRVYISYSMFKIVCFVFQVMN